MSPPPGPGGPARVAGLVLAAGAGRRMGGPKALLLAPSGQPRSQVAVADLQAAGCAPVILVLGAGAEQARALLPAAGAPEVVLAPDWAEGLGASLRAGLAALEARAGENDAAVLVTLVDLPDVGAPVMRRVLCRWREEGSRSDALARATYAGRPGHPVLLGRDHWARLRAALSGDTGAGPYLAGRRVLHVTCDDLATGRDLDLPEDLEQGTA